MGAGPQVVFVFFPTQTVSSQVDEVWGFIVPSLLGRSQQNPMTFGRRLV